MVEQADIDEFERYNDNYRHQNGAAVLRQVAQALNMSTRTLYNKLESSGTTYREVLDETRRELAEEYIRQELPIYEIAYLIGFSDTANFSRAFKKWTWMSPMELREPG